MKNINEDEQSINNYLLGQGTEEERKSIEDRYFRDADFYEQILAQEDELIHDYLKGLLSPSRKALFEKHFLHSERRHQKFLFVKRLINYADEHPWPSAALAETRMSRRIGALKTMLPSSMIATATAAVLLVALAAACLYYKYRGESPIQENLAAGKPVETAPAVSPSIAPMPQAPSLPAGAEASPASSNKRQASGPADRKSDAEAAGKEPTGRSTLSAPIPAFVFNSGALRSGGVSFTESEIYSIRFASHASSIRLDVHLDEQGGRADHPVYEVVVKTLDGKEVFRQMNVKPIKTRTRTMVQFSVHTNLLNDGDHVLFVNPPTSAGKLKSVSEKFFNVKRY